MRALKSRRMSFQHGILIAFSALLSCGCANGQYFVAGSRSAAADVGTVQMSTGVSSPIDGWKGLGIGLDLGFFSARTGAGALYEEDETWLTVAGDAYWYPRQVHTIAFKGIDPFVTAGYSRFIWLGSGTSFNEADPMWSTVPFRGANMLNTAVGCAYWFRRWGLRAEVWDDICISCGDGPTRHYWALRAGFQFKP